MTKEAALFKFWSSFGIPAFVESDIPSDPENVKTFLEALPTKNRYITYQVATDSFGRPVSLTASVWDKDRDGYSALEANNRKTREISQRIGPVGCTLPVDGGTMRIKKGHPFAQAMGDPTDDTVKRSALSLVAEFYTND